MSLLFSTGVIAASGLAKGAPGMVLLTPTSITHSGTSASIGANGQVTFTAVTSLSLNGVFSADFDNYVVSCRMSISVENPGVAVRMRASGSDASGSNYTYQYLDALSTTVSAARGASATSWLVLLLPNSTVAANGFAMQMYGPALAQPTAVATQQVNSLGSARLSSSAATHSLSTAYDGMTLFPNSGNMTGALQVYGVRS